jgi:glycosyltransferase involved in cell wall biosynthesis
MPNHIVHLTSAHARYDTRIFIKMCSSLATQGYKVSLVVADGLGGENKNGVDIVDAGAKSGGRLSRMTNTVKKVYTKAKALDADIYHLHDPELIPIGLLLKLSGKKVIFDAHEDLPKQLLAKPYLNPFSLKILASIVSVFENLVCCHFDGIVAATPFIRDKFLKINRCTIDINNFPVTGELYTEISWSDKKNEICYVGGIGSTRGIRETVQAFEYIDSPARLNLGGRFSEHAVEAEVKNSSGWAKVNELGFLDRNGVRETLERSVAGLVTLHPIINYLDALPVKMFEYMAAGIPVIASNFPLWKEIVEGSSCGICVDPMNPKAIAEAIDFMVNNPEQAKLMGENGKRAVYEKYNWGIEKTKLFAFYKSILEK